VGNVGNVSASEALSPDDVLSFWMGDGCTPREEWFQKSDALDEAIRCRFGPAIARAASGDLDAWRASPRGRLALVILLDQFSRNAMRNTPRAFAQDDRALGLALEALDAGEDAALLPLERVFLCMPLVHAEDRAAQARAVGFFEKLSADAPPSLAGYMRSSLGYARAHCAIVDRFGRFPHRNAVLGRATTPEEAEFLRQEGSTF
jgi:uncharacterized protein (DUF924 family)